MYSKHRNSDSFRQEEAAKKLKRAHPVNMNFTELIDVNEIVRQIDDDAGRILVVFSSASIL